MVVSFLTCAKDAPEKKTRSSDRIKKYGAGFKFGTDRQIIK